MKLKRYLFCMFFFFSLSGMAFAQIKNVELPGKYQNYTLLPNGWKLSPQGKQVAIGELPLNMVVTKDGHYAISSNSGMGQNSLSVVDLKTGKEVQRMIIDNTWVGLAFGKNEKTLYVSGGNDNKIFVYRFDNGKLSVDGSIKIGERFPKGKISITGLAYFKKKNELLAVSQRNNSLYVIDLKKKEVVKEFEMMGKCYEIIINHAQTFAYVSIWGEASVEEINLKDYSVSHVYKTGDHPNEMAITKNGNRLFVTNANNNSVTVLDLKEKRVSETIVTSLTPDAPYGSTPDALTLMSRDQKLLVANADNNYLAVFDVSKKEHAKNLGFIPVGWYPTAVKYVPNTDQILVANGKGISSRANPDGPNPTKRRPKNWHENYSGSMFMGTLSIIHTPNPQQLAVMSKRVYDNTPFIHKEIHNANAQHVIPLEYQKGPSKIIKHVFYIIRENRTYDQVLGDLKEGNGDPALCLFGQKITPNAHQISSDFTLYDNFYVDAEVSADGHNWSTAAYATDYVEKLWPVNYGSRGAPYQFEGGCPIAAPSSGYIWNDAMKHHKSFRDYGEFSGDKDLDTVLCKTYPGFNLNISDLYRYQVWKQDFDSLEKINQVPALTIMRLPNDHCWGTRPGQLTPLAYVAQNDDALGKIVDAISHSKIWKESIIFVLEDDAQNGPDHVDAHRSVLLVISPYVKHHFVDHTLYTTSGVLKTIELILGLPPMTQYDLAANPIINSVTDSATFTPFVALPPETDIHNKNLRSAYGARLSEKLNFTREDAVPDGLYNKILWKAVKGKNAAVPAPVHSAFVQEHAAPDND